VNFFSFGSDTAAERVAHVCGIRAVQASRLNEEMESALCEQGGYMKKWNPRRVSMAAK